MGEYLDVMHTDDMKDGEMREVDAAGHQIVIAKVEGTYYAISNRCPHMGARLVEGTLEGVIVTCPKHGSQFDLRDGSVVRWTKWSGLLASASKLVRSPKQIITYKVKLEGDRALIEV